MFDLKLTLGVSHCVLGAVVIAQHHMGLFCTYVPETDMQEELCLFCQAQCF